jgi:transcriptional regulator with XRE-family HTH domain
MMSMLSPTLSMTLQKVRKARRLSQLELSMRLKVSQRHISFVESGRAKPSRELLSTWLQALDAPLVLQNQTMLQAGYAPAYSNVALDDPSLSQAHHAIQQLLDAHDPMPALVIDGQWNLLHLNQGGKWLAALLMPNLIQQTSEKALNLLDLLVHPEGLFKAILNPEEAGPAILAHLRREAVTEPSLTIRVEAFAALIRQRTGLKNLSTHLQAIAPLITTRYATQYGELSFFSIFSTFGTPQDITLASLRVEHLFAADESTKAIIRAHRQ